MKKRILSMLLAIVMVVGLVPGFTITASAADGTTWDGTTVATAFAGGTGTETDPYIIATAGQLIYLRNQVNNGQSYNGMYFRLDADLDMASNSFGDSIGYINSSYTSFWFDGHFDGNNHTISNLTITSTNGYTALFGNVGSGTNESVISDLTLSGVNITRNKTNDGAAALVGQAKYVKIENCIIESGTIAGKGGYTAGFVATKASGGTLTITNCINRATITYNGTDATANTAGICAKAISSQITGCVNYGDVTSTKGFTSGILANGNSAVIEKCANYGDITNHGSYAAGILASSTNYSIKNCFNQGNVSAVNNTGGITYSLNTSKTDKIENCYNVGTVSITSTPSYNNYCDPITTTSTRSANTNRIINTYALADSGSGAITKTAYEFKNGTVATLLQGTQSETIWGQGSDYPEFYNGTNSIPEPPAAVTGITLSADNLTLNAGDSTSLTATVTPDDAGNKNISWSSSAPNIATVENGLVKAIAEGNAVITATAEDGGFTATCTVTVQSHSHEWNAYEGKCSTCTSTHYTHTDYEWTNGVCSICGVIGGYCGYAGQESSVEWVLTSADSGTTYMLTISGTGNMGEYIDYNDGVDAPWFDYGSQITTVVINDGVKDIGWGAFKHLVNLNSVSIPGSVTEIKRAAFLGASSLTSITLPDSITNIGQAVFKESGLTSILIPSSVTQIQGSTFSGCTKLTSVTLPNSITEIEGNAFQQCSSLSQITLPTGLTTVGQWAFNQSGLTSVTIPNSVTSLEMHAFSGCPNLKTVTINGTNLAIAERAFQGDEALETLTINNTGSVTIGDYAFMIEVAEDDDEVDIGDVGIGGWTPADDDQIETQSYINSRSTVNYTSQSETGEIRKDKLYTITLPENVTYTTDYATSFKNRVRSVDIGDAATVLAGNSIKANPAFTPDTAFDKTLTWSSSNPEVATVDDNGIVTGVSAGDTTITATSKYRLNGEFRADSCVVTVTQHTHEWIYSINDAKDTITATCAGCEANNSQDYVVTITLNTPAKTAYGDGKDANATVTQNPEGTFADLTVKYSGATYTESTTAPTDAGTYKATLTMGSGTNTATAEVTYTIAEAEPEYTAPTATNPTYSTGTEQALVKDGNATNGTMYYAVTSNTVTTAPTDESAWYTEVPTGESAGTYRVWYKVSGDTNYSDIKPAYVDSTISKNSFDAEITGINGWTYGENADTPSVSNNPGNGEVTYFYKLTIEGDEKYTETVPSAAGSYTVKAVIAETDNYGEKTITATFTIAKKEITAVVSADSKTYDGNTDATVTATVNASDLEGTDSITISGLSGTFADANVGTNINVAVSGTPQYSGTGYDNYIVTIPTTTTANITAKALTDDMLSLDSASFTFDGNTKTPVLTVKNILNQQEVTLTLGTDYTVDAGSQNSGMDVGTYTIKITGGGNYTGGASITWKITNKTMTVSAADVTVDYDENAHSITVTGAPSGATITYSTDGTNYSETNPTFTDVGTYTVYYNVTCANYDEAGGSATVKINIINQTAPEAPTGTAKTAATVELDAITTTGYGNVQYAYNTTNEAPTGGWQDETVFTGLTKNTTYYFFARYAGDQNHNPAVSEGKAITTLNTYTITYDLNVGTGTVPTAQTQDVGVAFTTASDDGFNRTGYTFLGWASSENATAAEYTEGASVSNIMTDTTLYAVWQINQYTIEYDLAEGTVNGTNPTDYTVESGDITLINPTREGYTFAGWTGTGLDAATLSVIIEKGSTGNRTYTATWMANNDTAYTVKHMIENLDGNGYTQYGNDDSKTGTTDTDTEAVAISIEGFTAPATITQQNIKADGSTVVEIYYSRNRYDLTFNLDNGSNPVTTSVKYGAAITAPADFAKTGYTFSGWDKTVAETMPANHVTYTAQWTAHTYTVKFDANVPADSVLVGGTMEDQTLTYDKKEALTANTYVAKGYTFAGWVYNETTYTDKQEVMNLAADQDAVITMKAVWDPADGVSYTVKHLIEKLDGSGYDVHETDTTRTGKTGASTNAIKIDIAGFTVVEPIAQQTIKGDGSTVVEIFYFRDSYKLTFDPANGSEPIVSTVKFEDTITKPSDPEKTGHTFAGWNPVVAEKMPAGDTTYTAQWRANTYTVALITNGGTIREGNITEYTYGIGSKLPTNITRSGYYFGGWYDNEDCKGTPVTEITTTDIGSKTFYAKWNFIYIPIIPSNPTYPPVVDGGDNGDVVVSPKNPEKGDTVTITPDPDAGYEVDEIVVTDKNGNPVTVIDNGDGTYSFKQPSGKVNIEVTFKEIVKVCPGDKTCPMYGYTDLDMTAWYHDGVHFCIENGLMNGTSTTTFAPNGTTTRAMIVTILWRLEGSPVVNYAMSFEDVAADTWYTEAVRWAQANKIVSGYSDEAFGPNDVITREQLATILYRYEQYKGGGFTGAWMIRMDYVDLADVSDWAYEAMCWCNMNGIVNGKPGKVLDPKGSATRAEAATMLYRYCEISSKEDN